MIQIKVEAPPATETSNSSQTPFDFNKQIICYICDEEHATFTALKEHLQLHKPQTEPHTARLCNICGIFISRDYNMKYHQLIHVGDKPFKCDICDAEFLTKGYLRRHIRVHVAEKPFKCSLCEKTFTFKLNLSRHTLTHAPDKPFKCRTCCKTYSAESSLNTHIKAEHMLRRFTCGICRKEFTRHHMLERHKLTHSKPARSSGFNTDVIVEDGLFLCPDPDCEKSFKALKNLRSHAKLHEGIQPYQCNSCGRAFSRRNNLRSHEIIHLGVKPFKCHDCNSSYANLSNFNKHKKKCNQRPMLYESSTLLDEERKIKFEFF